MGGIEKLGSVLKTLLFAAAMSYVFGDGESERELKYNYSHNCDRYTNNNCIIMILPKFIFIFEAVLALIV